MSRFGELGGKLYRGEVSYDFVGRRNRWYAISAVILLISLGALFGRQLTLGIEFEGGAVFIVPDLAGHRHRGAGRRDGRRRTRRGHRDRAERLERPVPARPDRDPDGGGVAEGRAVAVQGVRRADVGHHRPAGRSVVGGGDHQEGRPRPGLLRDPRRDLPVDLLRVADGHRGAGRARPRPHHHGRHLRAHRLHGHPGHGHRGPDDLGLLPVRHRGGVRQGEGEHPRHRRQQQEHLQRGRQPGAQPDPGALDQHLDHRAAPGDGDPRRRRRLPGRRHAQGPRARAVRRHRRRHVLLDLHRHPAARAAQGARPADEGAGQAGRGQAVRGRPYRPPASRPSRRLAVAGPRPPSSTSSTSTSTTSRTRRPPRAPPPPDRRARRRARATSPRRKGAGNRPRGKKRR